MRSAWWSGDYPVSQGYGCTSFEGEPFNPNHPECPHFHDGIDIAIPCGVYVTARYGGSVARVGVYGGGPYALVLSIGSWWVWLLHLQANFVNAGDGFAAGQIIGAIGTLGFSTGCHLHFQVTPPNAGYFSSVDPTPWLTGGQAGGCALLPLAPLIGIGEALIHGLKHIA